MCVRVCAFVFALVTSIRLCEECCEQGLLRLLLPRPGTLTLRWRDALIAVATEGDNSE